MNYQVIKEGRRKKVGIPQSTECSDLVWYDRDELKSAAKSFLHIRNKGSFLSGHEYQIALALSPVTRQDLDKKDLIGIQVVKATIKDGRPFERQCNYAAFTRIKENPVWEFSVPKGITYLFQGGESLHKVRVEKAFRNAVRPQINNFRKLYLDDFCEQNGYQQWAVDHIYPQTFESLMKGFLSLYQVDFELIQTHTDFANYGDAISDPLLLSQWRRYHYEHARLRFLDPKENSRLGNRAA